MENFQNLGLPNLVLQSLQAMNFKSPTPIQAQAIPVALEGRDILGSAQTGTGKTAAYLIPLVVKLLEDKKANALVLTPTRELATQVLDSVKQLLGKSSEINTALLIGGEPMFKQLNQLKNNPRIIVGTPGRINDHLLRKSLSLGRTNFVVFDETDRMLDLGFSVQLKEIAKYLPSERQTLMFSATMAQEILKLAYSYLNDAARITVGSTTSPVKNVKQEVVKTSESEKYGLLINQLEENSGSHIVFVKTKSGADKLAIKLSKQGHEADALHGDLRQKHRDKIIKAFRDYKHRILVATDVAARGLDIPHLQCVVNYDLPQCPEDYIHRVGRVGRAGAEGIAVSLLTAQDGAKWKAICKLIGTKADDVDDDLLADNTNRRKSGGRNDRRSTGRSEGSFKVGFKSRGDSANPSHFGNSARPARFDRDSKPSSFAKGERATRSDKDSKPVNFEKSAKPARFGRNSKSARFDRDSKPSSFVNGERAPRSDKDSKPFRSKSRNFGKKPFSNDSSASGGEKPRSTKTLSVKPFKGAGEFSSDDKKTNFSKPLKPKRKFNSAAR